ncbi:MAG: FAD-dependent oxidoreductase [Dehalococcoidales bacterium]|nr:FAD-dependent oxidoreductase [Dehalococcoidales bacterium]
MEKLEYDVAVVGTGAAGLTAALTAAEGGASVAVFEKRGVQGGASNLPVGGILCVESKYQREKNYPGTRDQIFKILTDFSHWRGNARLIRAWVEKTAGTVDWLEKQGVEFQELPDVPPKPAFSGGYYSELKVKGNGAALMKILKARAKKAGIETFMATAVRQIVQKGRQVTGVIAEDRSGKKMKVQAGAVIIATGGFVNNKEMVKKYAGYDLNKDIFPFFDLGSNGDGIRMAWEAGAATDGMGMHLYFGVPRLLIPRTQLHIASIQPYLWINQRGERFIDESISNPTFVGNALTRQPNRCAYLIFDKDSRKQMEEKGLDRKSPYLGFEKLDDVEGQMRAAIEKGFGNLFIADSLEDLADAINVKPESMKNTIDEYNEYCVKGHDDYFDKDPRFLHPVKSPRFYAFRLRVGCHGTIGGIKINERTEVLDNRDEPIPGLYSAGYDACCVYGDPTDYNWFVPGGTFSFALNSGRIAGESSLQFLQKSSG